jgi:hypothetical protein
MTARDVLAQDIRTWQESGALNPEETRWEWWREMVDEYRIGMALEAAHRVNARIQGVWS